MAMPTLGMLCVGGNKVVWNTSSSAKVTGVINKEADGGREEREREKIEAVERKRKEDEKKADKAEKKRKEADEAERKRERRRMELDEKKRKLEDEKA